MYCSSPILHLAFLPILLAPSLIGVAAENWHRHDPDLWHFVTVRQRLIPLSMGMDVLTSV